MSVREKMKDGLDRIFDSWIEILQAVFAVVILLSTTVLSDEGFSTAYRNIVSDYESDAVAGTEFESRKAVAQTFCFRLLIFSGVAELLLVWTKAKQTLRMSKLEHENRRITSENEVLVENIHNLLEGYLLNFAMYRLDFGSNDTNNERITLYVHDPENSCFVPAARYSQDPHLKQNGRDHYPQGDGCIGHAWRHGEDSFQIAEGPENKKYVEKQGRKGITEDVLLGFKMKSRFYFASRIEKIEGNEPLAVLVIESTEPDRFDVVTIRDRLEEEVKRNLAELVTRVRPYLSVPSDASGRGF